MKVPSWFCPVICSGLNTDEISPIKRVSPAMKVTRLDGKQFRFKQNKKVRRKVIVPKEISFENMEENKTMNIETTT